MEIYSRFSVEKFYFRLRNKQRGTEIRRTGASLHLTSTAFDFDFSIPGPYTNMSGEPFLNVNHSEAPTHYYLRDDSNLLTQRLKV